MGLRPHTPVIAVRTALITLLGVGAAYRLLLRNPILTWGATQEEATATLPGDELLEAADGVATRAIHSKPRSTGGVHADNPQILPAALRELLHRSLKIREVVVPVRLLGRADVGVAEHVLDDPNVACVSTQLGGERTFATSRKLGVPSLR